MLTLLHDIRYAFRALWRAPAATVAAIVTLALALGANTALFSLLNVALLKPLPFWQPEALVTITSIRISTGEGDAISAPDYLDWRDQARSFSGLAAWRGWGMALTGLGAAEDLSTARVTANLFQTLGVSPALGRAFRPEEDLLGAPRVAIVSNGFWRERLGGDSVVLGRSLTLDGRPYTIVGVMPAGFRFPDRDEVGLWTPMAFDSIELARRSQRMFNVIGRLAAGVTPAAAQSEVGELAERTSFEAMPGRPTWTARLQPAADSFRPPGKPLALLMGAVALVLLIGCANVANLILARGLGQEHAMGVRAALGASPLRLLRLPLLESLWLAGIAGAVGVCLGVWLKDALLALEPGMVPHWHRVELDWTVLGFAFVLSLVVAVGVGILPALRAGRTKLGAVLKSSGERTSAGRGILRVRSALVIGEVALAFTLGVGALLLVRTLQRLSEVDPGFVEHRLLTTSLSLAEARYPDDVSQRKQFGAIVDRVEALPGVVSAAFVTTLPLSTIGIDHDLPVAIAGRPVPEGGELLRADFRIATSGYFQTLGAALIRGRDITRADGSAAPRVMVINQTLARQLFGDRNPLDAEAEIPGGRYRIVGVAQDVHHRGLDAPARAEMFVPLEQSWSYGRMSLLVRTSGDPVALSAAIRAAIRNLDADQPIGTIQTMTELAGASVSGRRFIALLLGALATLGAALAALGVYAVMAVGVAQRRRELGIRLALGAAPQELTRLIVGEGLRLALLGSVAGLLAAVGATRLLGGLLYGVHPMDALSLAGTAVVLTLVALVAAWIPARRAGRVSAVVALRAE